MIDIRAHRDPRPLLRGLPLVVIPVLLLASTYPGQYRVPAEYWALAVAAGVVFLAGGRWPLAVSLVLAGLAIPMFRITAWGVSDLVPFLGAVALIDVVARTRPRAAVWSATAGWAAAVVLGQVGMHDTSAGRASTVVAAAAYIGLPLLLGLYLRGQRELTSSRAAQARTQARIDERTALARELHDVVAHHMASIVLRISVVEHVVGDTEPRIAAVLDDVRHTAAGALTDIRRLLTVLRDPHLATVALVDTDALATEIIAALDRIRAAGFAVDADIDTEYTSLDAIGRLTLLRLVQESLTNVMKHADRDVPVRFRMVSESGGIALRIVSGGRGGHRLPGHGIAGMRERAELAGGTVDIGPDGRDWAVRAWLPRIEGADEGQAS